MTSTRFTSTNPASVVFMGEGRMLCTWAKLAHRTLDAASGI